MGCVSKDEKNGAYDCLLVLQSIRLWIGGRFICIIIYCLYLIRPCLFALSLGSGTLIDTWSMQKRMFCCDSKWSLWPPQEHPKAPRPPKRPLMSYASDTNHFGQKLKTNSLEHSEVRPTVLGASQPIQFTMTARQTPLGEAVLKLKIVLILRRACWSCHVPENHRSISKTVWFQAGFTNWKKGCFACRTNLPLLEPFPLRSLPLSTAKVGRQTKRRGVAIIRRLAVQNCHLSTATRSMNIGRCRMVWAFRHIWNRKDQQILQKFFENT